ncbi:hypothetical protein D5S18_30970 [Nocardia panacis]|uniref:Peptidase n=1 Tax=Nocardia panacis TaxID=2340916 RepID=A0A3A4JKJ9_9NOCA|nr:hypothetical protein [Nocardia panacis]RJO69095.1 hypothetical protein D5S18_30970 [Nocardia panacis]
MGEMRRWLAARGRLRFCLTIAAVIALTGACGALLLVPNSVLPKPGAVSADSVVGQARAAVGDPRLDPVRRTMEPFGELAAERVSTGDGAQSLVVGHPGQRRDMEVLAGELPGAVAAVSQVWGRDWAGSAVVVLTANISEFAGLVHAGADLPTEIAAASVADPFVPGTRPTGQRVVFGPDASARVGPDGLRTLLRHELTHVAARAGTVDGAPLWMLEGFADYVAQHGQGHRFAEIAPTLTARLRAGEPPRDLPADREFGGAGAAFAYEQAWSVNQFIAERFGQTALVDLYHRIAAGRLDAAGTDRILRETLGSGRAEFVDGWRGWLAHQVG